MKHKLCSKRPPRDTTNNQPS